MRIHKCYKTRKVIEKPLLRHSLCYLCQKVQSVANDGLINFEKVKHIFVMLLLLTLNGTFLFDDIFNFQLFKKLFLTLSCCIWIHMGTSIGRPQNVFWRYYSRYWHKAYCKGCFSLSILTPFNR